METRAVASGGRAGQVRRAVDKVMSSTRVNVAFPFSQVKVTEPGEQLATLIVLVKDLADRVALLDPDAEAQRLARRAHDLVDQLR